MTSDYSAPPFWFRLAVVAGGACLLLGTVGAIGVFLRADEPARAAGPGLLARVRIEGAPRGTPLKVEATWNEADVQVTQGARRLEGSAEIWLLPPCPEGVEVIILVHDTSDDPPRLLGRQGIDVEPGAEAVVRVEPRAGG